MEHLNNQQKLKMLFKVILPSNEIFKTSSTSFQELIDTVKARADGVDSENITFKYVDSDQELVNLENEEDFRTAVLTNQQEKVKTLKVFAIFPDAAFRNNSESSKENKSRTIQNSSNLVEVIEKVRVCLCKRTAIDCLENFSNRVSKAPKWSSNCSIDLKNQMEFVQSFIGLKVQEALETNMKNILNWAMLKFKDHQNDLENTGNCSLSNHHKPETICSPFKHHNFAIVTENAGSLETDSPKFYCHECSKPNQGIKYFCLECSDYQCCEACEEKAAHRHPLLKIRTSESKSASTPRTSAEPKIGLLNTPENTNKTHAKYTESLSFFKFTEQKKVPYAGKLFLKDNEDEIIELKTLEKYQVYISTENIGKETWPQGVKICCINGIYRNQEENLLPLKPGAKQVLKLDLEAPGKVGRYLSQWKLCYTDDDNKSKSFGESLFIEIQVEQRKFINKKTEKKERSLKKCGEYLEDCQIYKRSKTFPETLRQHQKENKKRFSDARGEFAKFLNDFFPGDLEEKYEFLENHINKEEKDLNKVVDLYLLNLRRSQNDSKSKFEKTKIFKSSDSDYIAL